MSKVLKFYKSFASDLATLRSYPIGMGAAAEGFELLKSSQTFRTEQKEVEIFSLLKRLSSSPPKYMCEIGSRMGGTLYLFTRLCRPDATIISVDLEITLKRAAMHKRLATQSQSIKCVRGDSSSPRVIKRVKSILKGNELDFLFIDGDHSYEGVRADFMNYSPLVRKGGLIAFHDIVQDYLTRFGQDTGSYTGGVPLFWKELKEKYPERTEEFVEDPEQDGFGIGLLAV